MPSLIPWKMAALPYAHAADHTGNGGLPGHAIKNDHFRLSPGRDTENGQEKIKCNARLWKQAGVFTASFVLL